MTFFSTQGKANDHASQRSGENEVATFYTFIREGYHKPGEKNWGVDMDTTSNPHYPDMIPTGDAWHDGDQVKVGK